MNKKSLIKNHIISDVIKWKKNKFFSIESSIIREIPLRICMNESPCATLMYTPGQEKELALGFCFTEGILPDSWRENNLQWDAFDPKEGVISLRLDQPTQLSSPMSFDVKGPFKNPGPLKNPNDGESILNQILPHLQSINSKPQISFDILQGIEKQIRQKQKLFTLTGATHAACVFDGQGKYLFCCEDIARHNALDKAIGYALLEGVALSDKILCLTGRINYTLMRKAVCAQFPIVASVSAPTSMAVKISKAVDITLIGFLRSEEMNVYAGRQRIKELQDRDKTKL